MMFFLSRFCLISAVLLLGINIYGVIVPYDERSFFDKKLVPYEDALSQMDRAFEELGPSRDFFEKSVKIYADSIFFDWPKEISKVPIRDNYILYVASFFDSLLYKTGLAGAPDTFSMFESVNYERGFQRGFGICSQNALGLTDIYEHRYGIPAHMVGLEGHVVMGVINPDDHKTFLLDPSVGLLLPFDLKYAEQNLIEVSHYYQQTAHKQLFETYNTAGNIWFTETGADVFRPKAALMEKVADYLIWIIPFGLILVSILTYKKRKPIKG